MSSLKDQPRSSNSHRPIDESLLEAQVCPICKLSTDIDSILCRKCLKGFHFKCVGEPAQNSHYKCAQCIAISRPASPASEKTQVSKHSLRSTTSRKSTASKSSKRLELELKLLEEEKQLEKSFLLRKYQLLNQADEDMSSESSCSYSSVARWVQIQNSLKVEKSKPFNGNAVAADGADPNSLLAVPGTSNSIQTTYRTTAHLNIQPNKCDTQTIQILGSGTEKTTTHFGPTIREDAPTSLNNNVKENNHILILKNSAVQFQNQQNSNAQSNVTSHSSCFDNTRNVMITQPSVPTTTAAPITSHILTKAQPSIENYPDLSFRTHTIHSPSPNFNLPQLHNKNNSVSNNVGNYSHQNPFPSNMPLSSNILSNYNDHNTERQQQLDQSRAIQVQADFNRIQSIQSEHIHEGAFQSGFATFSLNNPQLQPNIYCPIYKETQSGITNNQPLQNEPNVSSQGYAPQNHLNALPNNGPQLHHNAHSLSANQIHARQTVSSSLPTFSGHPEEWPVFISTFEWSTAVCGLTDAENLIRLEKALKDEALKAVRHLLIHPSCVPEVLSTLKLLFGQPERIIQSFRNRIKAAPFVNINKLETLTAFAIHVKGLNATIKACGLLDELNNSILLQELVSKLPSILQIQWGSQKLKLINENKRANLLEFSNFIYEIGLSANIVTTFNDFSINLDKKSYVNVHAQEYAHTHGQASCVICKAECRRAIECPLFESADRSKRWEIVKKHNLCRCCLIHHTGPCKNKKNCGIDGCSFKHHPLLHNYNSESNQPNPIPNQSNDGSDICNAHNNNSSNVIFKIAPIKIFGKNEKVIHSFAFLDEGSSVNLIDKELVKQLGLSGVQEPLCLQWTGKISRNEKSSEVVQISIAGSSQSKLSLDVRTVANLGLPTQSLNYSDLSKKFRHLRGLPIQAYENAEPKLLIGLRNYKIGMPKEIREGKENEPVAVKTELGWIIYGTDELQKHQREFINCHECSCSSEKDLKLCRLMKNFYSIESLGISAQNNLISKEDDKALAILKALTKQRDDGHYETGLLWRYEKFELPESFKMAKRRLICLEQNLKKDPQSLKNFSTTIQEYESRGYIRKLSHCEALKGDRTWYLPTFSVCNKNKPGKFRIVWDAAAKVQGVSLNDMLLKGPDLFASLTGILFRFRQKRIAFSGDIEQMFHQVFIREEDQDAQRFLWRDCNPASEPQIYVMKVMIFGATCSPSISQYIKNTNASKYEKEMPSAVNAIRVNHYVDDYLDSTDSPEEGLKLISEVSYIHSRGGFNMRNWVSNDPQILKELGSKSLNNRDLDMAQEKICEKVLGIFWLPGEDCITFKVSTEGISEDVLCGARKPTKREILKILMSVYDPLGLVGHYLMQLKILMQDIWRAQTKWDEEITNELNERWNEWKRQLADLKTLKIHRCYHKGFQSYEGLEIQLHTFVDASESGYASASYIRLSSQQKIVVSLMGSKCRVAPLKPQSIPRMELMAALIGSRYAQSIEKEHTIKFNKRIFWTDSKTVISWLRSDSRKYHQFVGFRVSEILDLTGVDEWHWIRGKDNVADEATKYKRKVDLTGESRWIKGPSFLYSSEEEWHQEAVSQETTVEELRRFVLQTNDFQGMFNVERFSKWKRLLRAAAYVFHFMNILKGKTDKGEKELHQLELFAAERALMVQAQLNSYSEEISLMRENRKLPKNSPLYKLCAYLDDKGVVRLDGRIDLAEINEEHKHPIILPKEHYITRLIMLDYHERFHHLNHESAINELRQKFYVPRLRTKFKEVIKECQRCKVTKAMPKNPQMAKLPSARLGAFKAPFTFTGVDYFGPLRVSVGRHTEKRYGVLFTCMTMRAIHIEIAESLNTSSCILAIRKFIARRGTPREFFSDRGTNFIGTEKELKRITKEMDKNVFVRTFTSSSTKWNFNPPAAPHMGGAWERLIRSVKKSLYEILPAKPPTDEVLYSTLVEIENIINSRPLTYVPVMDENCEALTPNHFLIGSSNGLKPLTNCDDAAVTLKWAWLKSQQLAQLFWTRWTKEYLPDLTCRSKWYEKSDPVKVGDIVIVADPQSPRNVWPKGKVLEVKTANDGQVRSAKILTTGGVLERPAAKLAILHLENTLSMP